MATITSESDIEVENVVANDVKQFYKELEKLSTTPPDDGRLRIDNLISESDELLHFLVSNAFANSTWKSISVVIMETQSYFVGDRTALLNSIFCGLSRNTVIEEFSIEETGDEEEPARVSIPCLPPNLRKLSLSELDLREDIASDRKGLPDLIENHNYLKELRLWHCSFCPTALGGALRSNKSLKHLLVCAGSGGNMKDFFDSVNNSTIIELELFKDALGIPGIEAMHDAFKEQRLVLQKLGLYWCFGENEVPAVAKMLKDYTTIKDLDLSWEQLGNDGVEAIIASQQHNHGLQALGLRCPGGCPLRSSEAIKHFLKSRPDGTLEHVTVSVTDNWSANGHIQEEIDTLLDVNKLKPLISNDEEVSNSDVLAILQHERLDCTYYYLREKPQVIERCLEEPTWPDQDPVEPSTKRQKTRSRWNR